MRGVLTGETGFGKQNESKNRGLTESAALAYIATLIQRESALLEVVGG